MSSADLWTYRDEAHGERDLVGFRVEATDGTVGKIDEASFDVGESYLVVDTGPWIFGKKVMLPAGVVDQVDFDTETVFVKQTKDEIKAAPELDESRTRDDSYRDELGSYYGSLMGQPMLGVPPAMTPGVRPERSTTRDDDLI